METSLRELVLRYLVDGAFTIAPNGQSIQVRDQNNLVFLKNKLRKHGITDVAVTYSPDGNQNFTKDELKVVVVTSDGNGYNHDRERVFHAMNAQLARHSFTQLICGDRQIDRLVCEWAIAQRIPVRIIRPSWKKHGKAAGPMNYRKMLKTRPKPKLVIVFTTGGKSITWIQAERAGIPVELVPL